MNWYHLKRRLLHPWVLYMRRRERHQTGFIRAALELHYYRPTFYRFVAANMEDPDILVTAPLNEDSIVLDVGGYVGEWAARVQARYAPRIFLFEPDPGSFRAAEERFQGDPRVSCFEFGLADRDAELPLARNDMGSSFLEGGLQAPLGIATARIRDVVAVLDDLGLDRIDLMKVNIEGGEYDLLERLIESRRIRSIRQIQVQFHEWFDGAHRRRRRIRRALGATHALVWDYPFVWEKWAIRDPESERFTNAPSSAAPHR